MYLTSNMVSQIPVYPIMTLFDTVRPLQTPGLYLYSQRVYIYAALRLL